MKKDTLKKAVVLALAVCTIFAIYACGGEKEVTMKLGEKTTIGEDLEFTPVNVLVADKVFPPVSGSYPMGFTAKSGKSYATVVAKVKNLGEEDIKASDLCAFRLSVGEDTFTANMINALTDNETKLSSSVTLKAGATETFYFITEIDTSAANKETLAEFAFTKDGDEPIYNHKLTIDTTKPFAVTEKLELNKKITVDGLCELTPTTVKFLSKIVPSNPGYYYNYYKAQGADNKLLVVNMKTKNLSEKEKNAYDFYGVTAFYDGISNAGTVVSDDEKKANITQYEKLSAGTSRTTYGVLNMSKKAEKGKCDIYIYAGGTYYQYTYKK